MERKELFDHAKEAGLTSLSSAFSVKAVELLENIGVPAWKVGSGEINSTPLLDVMLETKKPILLSAGLANIREIEERVDYIQSSNVPLALFQCTTKYPTSFKDVGLNNMTEFMKQFDVPVGLSDHSGSIFPCLSAISLGASIVEVHITFGQNVLALMSVLR